MNSFSINKPLTQRIKFNLYNQKYFILQSEDNFHFMNTEKETFLTISFKESIVYISFEYMTENNRPFVYSVTERLHGDEKNEVMIELNQNVSKYLCDQRCLRFDTENSYIEFSLEDGTLMLISNKHLSINSHLEFQLMKF